MKIIKNKPRKIAGFSIIEIMAVVFIVSIGMVGMMNLIGQSIRVQRLNKHTLIAYQLAQEGIEFIRIIRDNNWLDSTDTNTFIETLAPGSYCLDIENIDLLDTHLEPCDLYLDLNNFYRHDSEGDLSPYSRLITIVALDEEGLDPNQAVIVKAKISWTDVGSEIEYIAETRLYDWY